MGIQEWMHSTKKIFSFLQKCIRILWKRWAIVISCKMVFMINNLRNPSFLALLCCHNVMDNFFFLFKWCCQLWFILCIMSSFRCLSDKNVSARSFSNCECRIIWKLISYYKQFGVRFLWTALLLIGFHIRPERGQWTVYVVV